MVYCTYYTPQAYSRDLIRGTTLEEVPYEVPEGLTEEQAMIAVLGAMFSNTHMLTLKSISKLTVDIPDPVSAEVREELRQQWEPYMADFKPKFSFKANSFIRGFARMKLFFYCFAISLLLPCYLFITLPLQS